MTGHAPAPNFQISPSTPIATELSRIGQSEIDFVEAQLHDIGAQPRSVVHQCRKAIKRLRALLRLGRRAHPKAWRKLDRKLRDAGRLLADARDADVIARTTHKLGEADGLALTVGKGSEGERCVPDDSVVSAVVVLLPRLRTKYDKFISDGDWSPESMRSCIDFGLRKAVRHQRRFRKSGRQRHAHNWRKSVQRCANQMRLFEGFDARHSRDQLDELSSLLGDYHDLTILCQALKSKRSDLPKKSRVRLRQLARQHQHDLASCALEMGSQLFSDNSQSFSASWPRIPEHAEPLTRNTHGI